MKYIHLLFFFFISINLIHCQSLTSNKGEEIKDRYYLNKKEEHSVIDENGNFIAIRPHPSMSIVEYAVEFYDKLNLKERIIYNTDKDTEIITCFVSSKYLYVVKHIFYLKNVSLRIDKINIDTKEKIEITIEEINKKKFPEYFKSLKYHYNVGFKLGDKLVLSIPFNRKKIIALKVISFDFNNDTTTSQTIFQEEDRGYKNITYLNTFQDKNSAYSLYSITKENGESFYQITDLNNLNKQKLNIPIHNNTFELINLTVKDNLLVISGLYSIQKRMKFKGYTEYKINLDDMNFLGGKNVPFSEEVLNYFEGFLKKKKNIDIREIYLDSEKNIYIIGQIHTIRKQTIPIGIPIASFAIGPVSAFVSFSPFHYKKKIYDDILITKLDANGNLIWDQLLQLSKTSKIKEKSNKRDSSYFTNFANNEIQIFMNGYINFDRKKLIIQQNRGKNRTCFYKIGINLEGDISFKEVFENKDSQIIFRANNTIMKNNIFYNLGQGNMRKQLLKINN